MTSPATAVFLSYASQDAAAAKQICDALRAAGVEVWFDQSDLRGGDAWDQKIRRQIRECTLFLPVISAATNARAEGYFRLEWKLAVDRSHLMADDEPFLVPVVLGDLADAAARVPDKFREVQWTRLKPGDDARTFAARVAGLLAPAARAGGGTSARSPAPAPAASRPSAPSRWRYAWVGVGLAFGLLYTLRPLWREPRREERPPAAAPVSAAAEVARIRAGLRPDEWTRADFDTFLPVVDRLLQAHPDNGEAWALRSLAHSVLVIRNLDSGTKPLEAAKEAGDRAQRLAPDSPLTDLSVGLYLIAMISRGSDVQAARAPIDRALARLPAEPLTRYAELASYWLGLQFEGTDRVARAWLEAEPKASFPAWILAQAAVARRRPDDALAWAERAAVDPDITGVRSFVTMLEANYYVRADLAAARAAIDRVPGPQRGVHRVMAARWLLAMAEKDYDRALQELEASPAKMLRDRVYHGPKALLAALAHEAAGRAEVAQALFREAEPALRAELAEDSDNRELRSVLALNLACLGRGAEARRELAFVEPLLRGQAPSVYRQNLVALVAQTHGVLGEMPELAAWLRVLLREPSTIAFTPASLRLDPRFGRYAGAAPVAELLAEYASLDAAPAASEKSVAVLPFANLSEDKTNEYFSDGISEELLNQLGKVAGLQVAGRASAFSFKNRNVPEPEIARQLGVAYIVTGSVQKSGAQVRITARLVKAADGFQVWSDKFTRDLKDIFAVQDEIAGLIAQNLQLRLGASGRTRRVVDPEAYRLVLEGRQFWNLRTAEGFTKAEAAFMQAVRLDPKFAEAYSGLACVYVIRSIYQQLDGAEADAEDLRHAEEVGRQALALDPESGDAEAALGYVDLIPGRLEAARIHFERAMAINPKSPVVQNWYALMLTAEGRLAEGMAHYREAEVLDPLWFINLEMKATTLGFAHRYAEALATIDRAIALRTDTFVPAVAERARALLALGRRDEAVAAARQILAQPAARPRWSSDAIAVEVLQQAGLTAEAAAAAERLFAAWPERTYLRGFTLAALGRFDEALPTLSLTPAIMARNLYWETRWDPWRRDPRFAALLAGMGRAQELQRARLALDRLSAEGQASP